MRRFSIADIIVSIVVIVLIALTLAPAIARMQRPYAEAKCQSNMQRMAEAMSLYTADNNNRYPTNRKLTGVMSYEVQLSAPPPGTQVIFMYGINWVEALYPYIQKTAEKTGQDWRTFLRCPNASNVAYGPTTSLKATAFVTYAFNGYLVEYSSLIVQNSEKVMMIRELDRKMNAEFRPYNDQMHHPLSGAGINGIRPAIGSDDDKPMDPFLTTSDMQLTGKVLTNKLHANGSHILFADGHTKYFTSDYMPDNSYVTTANSWDTATEQWYNFKPGESASEMQGTIAITP